jgi:hypothetical protein
MNEQPTTEAGRRLQASICSLDHTLTILAIEAEAREGYISADDAVMHAEAVAKARCSELVTRIEALHYPVPGFGYTPEGYGDINPACSSCGTDDEYAVPWPCDTVRAIREVTK